MNSIIAENDHRREGYPSITELYLPDTVNADAVPLAVRDTFPVAAKSLRHFPLENRLNLFLKRTFDILFSSLLILCVLSWMLPVLSVVILFTSKGPVFFRQKRNGLNGKVFTCIKFRSMYPNDEADTMTAGENDTRITGVGKILRRYHLDELPQLFNVIAGDMSLIGPRPYMVQENLRYEKIISAYNDRHSVKPGITGLAQSYGYFGSVGDTAQVRERFRLDIHYIRQWSFSEDLSIIFRTLLFAAGRNRALQEKHYAEKNILLTEPANIPE